MITNPTVVVHFYRATVMHADVWRRRLDITTNWSVVSTAGIITFAFSEPTHPHLSILVAYPFIFLFIMMESRRYQMYDMWRHRVRLLNRFIVAPALDASCVDSQRLEAELYAMSRQLGTSIPRMTLRAAVGYRIRRNYGLLFAAVLIMWLIKLVAHPTPCRSFEELVARGAVAGMPGWVTFGLVFGFCIYAFYLGASAPTERMRDWVELSSPLNRMLRPHISGQELSLTALHPMPAPNPLDDDEEALPPEP